MNGAQLNMLILLAMAAASLLGVWAFDWSRQRRSREALSTDDARETEAISRATPSGANRRR